MENAVQALLIAAGIMMAIMLISLVLLVRNRMSRPVAAIEEQKKVEQIQNFNTRYLTYEQNLLSGSEVLSILSKAYDSAVALEPITKEDGSKDSKKARKMGSSVNEPIVNVEIRFKSNDPKFKMELRYEAAEFSPKGEFIGKPRGQEGMIEAKFDHTIAEVLNIQNDGVKKLLGTTNVLNGPKEITATNIGLIGNNVLKVYEEKKTQEGKVIFITDAINNFIGMGGNNPSIIKKNTNIKPDNNWIKLKLTTPAADFIRKSFKWVDIPHDEQYNSEGYIKKIVFEEI